MSFWQVVCLQNEKEKNVHRQKESRFDSKHTSVPNSLLPAPPPFSQVADFILAKPLSF